MKCLECGTLLPTNVHAKSGTFCQSSCRHTFNNRRAVRGAELYDLFMELRYNRAEARPLKVWTFICRIAQFHAEDDAKHRGGRKSWNSAKTVLDRKPWLRNKVFKVAV